MVGLGTLRSARNCYIDIANRLAFVVANLLRFLTPKWDRSIVEELRQVLVGIELNAFQVLVLLVIVVYIGFET